MSKISTIIFDYGGVVAADYCEPYTSQLAALLAVSSQQLEGLVSESSEHGGKFRLGVVDLIEFWDSIAHLIGKDSIKAAHAQDLWARSFVPRPEILTLASHLRQQCGVRTVILANIDKYRADYVRRIIDLDRCFDGIFFSCDTGYLKPDPRAFTSILSEYAISHRPEEVLFIDDRLNHVDVAHSLGLQSIHFRDSESLIWNLSQMGFPRLPRHNR